jgi:hypothetical protein
VELLGIVTLVLQVKFVQKHVTGQNLIPIQRRIRITKVSRICIVVLKTSVLSNWEPVMMMLYVKNAVSEN